MTRGILHIILDLIDKLLKLNIPYVLYNFKDIPEDEKDKNLVLSNYLLEVLNKYKIETFA